MYLYGLNLDLADCVNFMQLEQESNYTINPIYKADSLGKQRLITYKIEANIYIPHNDYAKSNLLVDLASIKSIYQKCVITIGDAPIPKSDIGTIFPEINNTTSGANIILETYDMTYAIESVELRPRLKISIISYKKDISNLFQ
jgi:hypothetical protein